MVDWTSLWQLLEHLASKAWSRHWTWSPSSRNLCDLTFGQSLAMIWKSHAKRHAPRIWLRFPRRRRKRLETSRTLWSASWSQHTKWPIMSEISRKTQRDVKTKICTKLRLRKQRKKLKRQLKTKRDKRKEESTFIASQRRCSSILPSNYCKCLCLKRNSWVPLCLLRKLWVLAVVLKAKVRLLLAVVARHFVAQNVINR